jgi:hypothetical protein
MQMSENSDSDFENGGGGGAAPPQAIPRWQRDPPPITAELREGSRVRVDGLVSKPEMNGRTGVICGIFNAHTGRWTVELDDDDGSSSRTQIAIRPCNLKVTPNAPIPQLPEVHSSSKPITAELREGSRVRVDGLVSKPEMNGRTGVICGIFNAHTGRWTVELDDDDGSSSRTQIAIRPCNLKVTPAAIFLPEPEVFVSSSTFEVSDVEFCILHLRQAFVDAQVNLLN